MSSASLPSESELLTTGGVAREFDKCDSWVRLQERRGELPAIRLSNGVRVYRRADVETLRARRAAKGQS